MTINRDIRASQLYLVSCTNKKTPTPRKAKNLYISPWFGKAKTYVESTNQRWFILSAKYGLVDPNSKINPYDKSMNSMPVKERMKWAEDVSNKLRLHITDIDTIYILAGHRYREFLVPKLRDYDDVNICVPMEGLRIGEQLRWLNERVLPS